MTPADLSPLRRDLLALASRRAPGVATLSRLRADLARARGCDLATYSAASSALFKAEALAYRIRRARAALRLLASA